MKYQFTQEELANMETCPWLTDRERAVFELYFRRGWGVSDVAAELDLSDRTIDTCLKMIREKAKQKD